MSTIYDYTPHPHVESRREKGASTIEKVVQNLHPNERKISSLNDRIGLAITTRVGTMWAAYVFALLALVSLPAAILSGSLLVIVAWIAQTFLQLVLLPVIIVGQNIQAAASDTRAEATYQDAGAILDEALKIQEHLAAQDVALAGLLEKFAALEKKTDAGATKHSAPTRAR